MNNPLEFHILIAEENPGDAKPLRDTIHFEMSPHLEDIELRVHVVDTLAGARELRDMANVTILGLKLKDADKEEVFSAVPYFHRPVFIYTEEADLETKAKCKDLKVEVVIKGQTTPGLFAVTLLEYLSKDVKMTMAEAAQAENSYAAQTS